jgi:hypothetical protein
LALHNYHQAVGTFPLASAVAYSEPGVQTNWGTFGAHAFLLPYLEQAPIYNACSFSWSSGYQMGRGENITVVITAIQAFLCPSDALAGTTGLNSYVGSLGTTTDVLGTLSSGSTGFFGCSSAPRRGEK